MPLRNNLVVVLFAFVTLVSKLRAQQELEDKTKAALGSALITFHGFLAMFETCVGTQMPKKDFIIDNMKGYINYPSRTTVGVHPKLTSNRKFFANVIATPEFKHMLDIDSSHIINNFVEKFKYCDNVIMKQELITDFYDRDVDQTHL